MSRYNQIDSHVRKKIYEIFPADRVIEEESAKEKYSHDETKDISVQPDIVVLPQSSDEVSQLMRLANQHRFPVTPYSAGTGLTGGAIPLHGGVSLSMEKMNRILEIDQKNLMAVVEPGVINLHLKEKVRELGLYYPPDPSSMGSSTIGGNVAECSGGPHAVKYGITRDYILGMEVVLPSGDVINLSGKLLKNVTGYSLWHLIIGSEGTLAIVTKIILKLIAHPKFDQTMFVPFPDTRAAVDAVAALKKGSVLPCVIEFMERAAVETSAAYLGIDVPGEKGQAYLLLEVDGMSKEVVQEDSEKIGECCLHNGALDVLIANSKQMQADIWKIRRITGEAVKHISVFEDQDTVVPPDALPELMEIIDRLREKHPFKFICYGHAAEGNIHVNVLKGKLNDTQWNEELPKVTTELFQEVVAIGGMISGEHGIGLTQKHHLPIAVDDVQINLMKDIKRVFDPHYILNPDKIFDL